MKLKKLVANVVWCVMQIPKYIYIAFDSFVDGTLTSLESLYDWASENRK